MSDFKTYFEQLTGRQPFPWQVTLFRQFLRNELPDSCELPTGLGKTSVIPIWLIALAMKANVPRRLVYVVNRRTVVDQTTNEIESIRKKLLDENSPEIIQLCEQLQSLCGNKNASVPFGISTLRGQFADNQEWAADPARPAVICGTVDMIGSRLLFSGYRIGFKWKPLHAGFLGQDSLIVHDEAHLEPAFQKLLVEIQREQQQGRFPDIRPLKVLEMSATSHGSERPFRLTDADFQNETIRKRIHARKQLDVTTHSVEDEKKDLPAKLAELAREHRESGQAVIVFARSVDVVDKVVEAIKKNLRADSKDEQLVITLTGTMRGLERDQLARENAVFQRFLPEGNRNPAVPPAEGTVYLVCTSAGEVGINLSANHLVCDLSTFDSMVQRFGRMNRFGEYEDSRIDVVFPKSFGSGDKIDPVDERRKLTLRLLNTLNGDASPHTLGNLPADQREAAFAPRPQVIPVSDILFDTWALTSIQDKLPGRPPVEEFLHGLADWEPARTQVAWREEVAVFDQKENEDEGESLLDRLGLSPDKLLEDYPIKPHEVLQDMSGRIFDKLKKIADRWNGPVWVTDQNGDTVATALASLVDGKKDQFSPRMVILPPQAGGLENGLLTATSTNAKDVADDWGVTTGTSIRRRVRKWNDEPAPSDMRLIRTVDLLAGLDPEFEPEQFESEENESENRFWKWYVRPASADDDGSKTSTKPVLLNSHTNDVVNTIDQILSGLTLDPDPERDARLKQAIRLAAQFHDLGKHREMWQRGIGRPDRFNHQWFAKSGRDWKGRSLTRYRHEFGSLLDLQREESFQSLDEESKDLALHLIATHHGRGRPHFTLAETIDPDSTTAECREIAAEIPRRYARLQRRYGRWGLAYLESLLRAADYAASAEPSAFFTGELA